MTVGGTQKQTAEYVAEELKRWSQIVKDTGTKIE